MTAERVAKRLYGVIAVANDIEVKIPGASRRSDIHIAAAVLSALEWDASGPKGRCKVNVRKGWVALLGQGEWRYQRESADRGVKNQFRMKSHVIPQLRERQD